MHSAIKEVLSNIFIYEKNTPNNPIGRRMFVIRLSDRKLILHSPILLQESEKDFLDSLGDVSTLLIPNSWHTLDIASFHTLYPNAQILYPSALHSSLQKKIHLTAPLEDAWPFQDILSFYLLDGLKKPEAVFFHHPTKTLFVTDVFFNFSTSSFSGFTLWLMSLNKATQFGPTRLYHMAMVKDKTKFLNSLKKINTQWNIEHIFMCHGNLILHDGGARIKALYS